MQSNDEHISLHKANKYYIQKFAQIFDVIDLETLY